MMGKFMLDILTGIDNQTFDSGRVLSVVSFGVYFSLAFGGMFTDHPWCAMDFAGGIGTMAVGFGLNLRLKQGTEPGGNEISK